MDKYKQERHEYVKYMVDRILTKLEENSEHELLAFATLSLECLLRKDEILKLKWNQVDFSKAMIKDVEVKNNYTIPYIKMNSKVEHALKRLEYYNKTASQENVFPVLKTKRVKIGELIGEHIGDVYFNTHELRGLAITLKEIILEVEYDKKE